MSMPARFSRLSGEWKGTKRLYLGGESGPEKTSASRMTIAKAARGCFELLDYTWKYEGSPHEGLLVLGYDDKQNAATAAWADSWHMSQKIMYCEGTIDAAGVMIVTGSCEAPPGPDWLWRIAISTDGQDTMRIVMHNVSPQGNAELAVDADFVRVG